jgi:hypothetical protein
MGRLPGRVRAVHAAVGGALLVTVVPAEVAVSRRRSARRAVVLSRLHDVGERVLDVLDVHDVVRLECGGLERPQLQGRRCGELAVRAIG